MWILSLSHCHELTGPQGVYMGSGIGSLDDVYDTTVAYAKGVSYIVREETMELTLARAIRRCPLSSFLDS
jgi:hypothetical protein